MEKYFDAFIHPQRGYQEAFINPNLKEWNALNEEARGVINSENGDLYMMIAKDIMNELIHRDFIDFIMWHKEAKEFPKVTNPISVMEDIIDKMIFVQRFRKSKDICLSESYHFRDWGIDRNTGEFSRKYNAGFDKGETELVKDVLHKCKAKNSYLNFYPIKISDFEIQGQEAFLDEKI